MSPGSFRFDDFTLDPQNRRLERAGAPVPLNARYFDALALLVREEGRLVTKDRFLEEVWRGVPVTDEALTQCIRTLRRQLGDAAASPRFIETAHKHGYRFIAPVERVEPEPATGQPTDARARALRLGMAGTVGGGAAGLLGGVVYGALVAAGGVGGTSALLVLVCLTAVVGLLGGAGVAFGVAAAEGGGRRPAWGLLGGAAGGLLVGAGVKLIGLDAFDLLLGRSPGDITGAPEGAVLGAAVASGLWLGRRGAKPVRRSLLAAGLTCGVAGVFIVLLGGRLMGGSLELLARGFPDGRLRLDNVGRLLGEGGFGPLSQAVTAGLEAALFGACVAGAMAYAGARRALTAF